jgi:hypothetical protein
MKKHSRSECAAVALLALLLVVPAVADETPRIANVLIVDNESWRTDLAVVAPDGEATVRISDCIGFGGAYTVPLARGGGHLVPSVSHYQCSRTKLGVVKLRILEGEPRLWTQSYYRDAQGNQNVVMLPTLPDPLPRSYENDAEGFTAEYLFEGIENASIFGRSTFVALIPDGDGATQVELTVSSYTHPTNTTTETVTIDDFTFYELKTPVEFGRLTLKHLAPPDSASSAAPGLFAVALVGNREAGSPRVEVPRTRFAAFSE